MIPFFQDVKRARSSSEESKGQAEKRSRSMSPKPNANFVKKLVDGMGKEGRRKEEKKHKKQKHNNRSRSREKEKHKKRDRSRSEEKYRHKEKERKRTHGHHSSDDEDRNRKRHEEETKKWKDEKRRKMRKLSEQEEKAGSDKKTFPSQGTVSAHNNFEGPECPKCGQVCKDNGNMKNHLLSHYYQDFYRCTPDTKPFACPSCGKESRDRITMIRHFAFSHNMLYELTDVTPEMLNGVNIRSGGPKTRKPKDHEPDMFKKKEIVDRDSGDDDKKFKERMLQQHNGPPTDKNSVDTRTSFGKQKDHKHKKEKKDKRHKDHKKEETEEERTVRKKKRQMEKETDRSGSENSRNPLTLMAKKTPAPSTPAPDGWRSTSEPRRRIAHVASSCSPSPAAALSTPEDQSPVTNPHASDQEDESDDDFGDLPTPVFAE